MTSTDAPLAPPCQACSVINLNLKQTSKACDSKPSLSSGCIFEYILNKNTREGELKTANDDVSNRNASKGCTEHLVVVSAQHVKKTER